MQVFTRYDGVEKAVAELRRVGFVVFSAYDSLARHLAAEVVMAMPREGARIGITRVPRAGRWLYVFDTAKYASAQDPELIKRLIVMDASL